MKKIFCTMLFVVCLSVFADGVPSGYEDVDSSEEFNFGEWMQSEKVPGLPLVVLGKISDVWVDGGMYRAMICVEGQEDGCFIAWFKDKPEIDVEKVGLFYMRYLKDVKAGIMFYPLVFVDVVMEVEDGD